MTILFGAFTCGAGIAILNSLMFGTFAELIASVLTFGLGWYLMDLFRSLYRRERYSYALDELAYVTRNGKALSKYSEEAFREYGNTNGETGQ
jgi:hypothetical protein